MEENEVMNGELNAVKPDYESEIIGIIRSNDTPKANYEQAGGLPRK